jgi:cell division protein FtsB
MEETDMENKTRLSMIISLVAAMFILSTFSGVVGAQTSDDMYKQNMDKYQSTKKKLDAAQASFEQAYSKLRNLNDIKSREELRNKAREYLLSAIDHTRSHLEILKTRVGQGEIGTISFDPSGIIDDHIKELDQIKANVEAAQTIPDFIAANRELKDLWVKIRLETRYYIGEVLNNRIDKFITKTDNVTKSMDAAIKKLNDNGTDTSRLTADEASFNQLVTEAKANQANTTALFNTHTGFADNGTLKDANLARDFLKQGDASQRATIKSLKEVSKQVLKFVRDFRQISRGEIKVEGKVTSTLSGKGE